MYEAAQVHDDERRGDDGKGVVDGGDVVVEDHYVNVVQRSVAVVAVVTNQEVHLDAYAETVPLEEAVPCAASAYGTFHVHDPSHVSPFPSLSCLVPACLAHSRPFAMHALYPHPEVPTLRVYRPADTPDPSTYHHSWGQGVQNFFHDLEKAIAFRSKTCF